MTAYIYAANVVCPIEHIALGNALTAAIDPDTGGAETFNKGVSCYPAGTTFAGVGPLRQASNPVSAKATFPLLTAGGYETVAEFMTTGPWPKLNGMGFSDAQIAFARNVLRIEAGPRAEYESRGIEFVNGLGYAT